MCNHVVLFTSRVLDSSARQLVFVFCSLNFESTYQWSVFLPSWLVSLPLVSSDASLPSSQLLLALVLLFLCLFALGVCGLGDDAHHILLESLLLEEETVFVPDEVGRLHVVVVALHAAFEETQDEAVVGVSSEAQPAAVLHEFLELAGLVHAEFVDSDFLLFALDVIIFFILGASGKALPGERAAEEVQKHVADGLEVIAAGLLVTDVGVDGGVAGSSGEVLSLAEGDVLSLRVLVALGKTKVDDVNVVLGAFGSSDQEVVRLDVAMDDALFVDFLNSLDLVAG